MRHDILLHLHPSYLYIVALFDNAHSTMHLRRCTFNNARSTMYSRQCTYGNHTPRSLHQWQTGDCCVLQFNCVSVHGVRRCTRFDDARSTTSVSLLLLYFDVVLLMVVVLLFLYLLQWYCKKEIEILVDVK